MSTYRYSLTDFSAPSCRYAVFSHGEIVALEQLPEGHSRKITVKGKFLHVEDSWGETEEIRVQRELLDEHNVRGFANRRSKSTIESAELFRKELRRVFGTKRKIMIVTSNLPVTLYKTSDDPNGWRAEWILDDITSKSHDSITTEIGSVWVGCVTRQTIDTASLTILDRDYEMRMKTAKRYTDQDYAADATEDLVQTEEVQNSESANEPSKWSTHTTLRAAGGVGALSWDNLLPNWRDFQLPEDEHFVDNTAVLYSSGKEHSLKIFSESKDSLGLIPVLSSSTEVSENVDKDNGTNAANKTKKSSPHRSAVPASPRLTLEEQKGITAVLNKMGIVPIFPPQGVHDGFTSYCYSVLKPVMHNVLETGTQRLFPHAADLTYHSEGWRMYQTMNEAIARIVYSQYSPGDVVWTHDYPLMLVPSYLVKWAKERGERERPPQVFFMHAPFPTSEIFRTLPVREEILYALLEVDVIGFHTFNHARHFLHAVRRLLGFSYRTRRGGSIGLDIEGRDVVITISHVGVETPILDKWMISMESAEVARYFGKKYEGKVVIAGFDSLQRLSGIAQKLLAFQHLLEENSVYRDRVVLIQRCERGRFALTADMEKTSEELRKRVKLINQQYGPVIDYEEAPAYSPTYRIGLFHRADILMQLPIREGLNLLPLEYVYVRTKWQMQRTKEMFEKYKNPYVHTELLDKVLNAAPSPSRYTPPLQELPYGAPGGSRVFQGASYMAAPRSAEEKTAAGKALPVAYPHSFSGNPLRSANVSPSLTRPSSVASSLQSSLEHLSDAAFPPNASVTSLSRPSSASRNAPSSTPKRTPSYLSTSNYLSRGSDEKKWGAGGFLLNQSLDRSLIIQEEEGELSDEDSNISSSIHPSPAKSLARAPMQSLIEATVEDEASSATVTPIAISDLPKESEPSLELSASEEGVGSGVSNDPTNAPVEDLGLDAHEDLSSNHKHLHLSSHSKSQPELSSSSLQSHPTEQTQSSTSLQSTIARNDSVSHSPTWTQDDDVSHSSPVGLSFASSESGQAAALSGVSNSSQAGDPSAQLKQDLHIFRPGTAERAGSAKQPRYSSTPHPTGAGLTAFPLQPLHAASDSKQRSYDVFTQNQLSLRLSRLSPYMKTALRQNAPHYATLSGASSSAPRQPSLDAIFSPLLQMQAEGEDANGPSLAGLKPKMGHSKLLSGTSQSMTNLVDLAFRAQTDRVVPIFGAAGDRKSLRGSKRLKELEAATKDPKTPLSDIETASAFREGDATEKSMVSADDGLDSELQHAFDFLAPDAPLAGLKPAIPLTSELADSVGPLHPPSRGGCVILSEFSTAAHALNSNLVCNPWTIRAVAAELDKAIMMTASERSLRQFRDYHYAIQNPSAAWSRACLQDVLEVRLLRLIEHGQVGTPRISALGSPTSIQIPSLVLPLSNATTSESKGSVFGSMSSVPTSTSSILGDTLSDSILSSIGPHVSIPSTEAPVSSGSTSNDKDKESTSTISSATMTSTVAAEGPKQHAGLPRDTLSTLSATSIASKHSHASSATAINYDLLSTAMDGTRIPPGTTSTETAGSSDFSEPAKAVDLVPLAMPLTLPSVPMVDVQEVVNRFLAAKRRILIIDYGGSLVSRAPVQRRRQNFSFSNEFNVDGYGTEVLPADVVSAIEIIAKCPSTAVYISSGLRCSAVENIALAAIPSVGLAAENGLYISHPSTGIESEDKKGSSEATASDDSNLHGDFDTKSSTYTRKWVATGFLPSGNVPSPVTGQHTLAADASSQSMTTHLLPKRQKPQLCESDWKRVKTCIMNIMNEYMWRVNGSFVREYDSLIAWDFRLADREWAGEQAVFLTKDIQDVLTAGTSGPIGIAGVKSCVTVALRKSRLEVALGALTKSSLVANILHHVAQQRQSEIVPVLSTEKVPLPILPADFVLAVGDDTTDEEMFSTLNAWRTNCVSLLQAIRQSSRNYPSRRDDSQRLSPYADAVSPSIKIQQALEGIEQGPSVYSITVGRKASTDAEFYASDAKQIQLLMKQMASSILQE